MVQEKEVKGGCEALNLNGTITNVATSCTTKTTPTANWPTGAAFPFVITIGRNTATEEQILCSTRSGSTINFTTRGYAGTTAVQHTDNETIEHTVDAVLLTDAIHAAAHTTGLVTTAEDILVATGNGTFKRLAKGSTGQILQILAGAVGYGALPAASVVAGTVGVGGINASNQFAAGVVDSAAILDGAIVNADINAAAAIANTKLATNPLARANHTGTQLAATVSDFDTQVRTSRLDQMAAPSAAVPLNAQKITGLATPTAGTDAATKAYADGLVGTAWTTYTPTWSASGTQPALGNGILQGAYLLIGTKTVLFRIRLSLGGTTTKGTGTYAFALPFTAVTGPLQVTSLYFNDATNVWTGFGQIGSGATTVAPYTNSGGASGSAVLMGNTNLGSAADLVIEGIYEAA